MTAAQEIQAAIEKLTTLKEQSTPGPWGWDSQGIVQSFDISVQVGKHEWERIGVVAPEHVRDADAELIITLHRTIDAQLEILRLHLDSLTNPDYDHEEDEDFERDYSDILDLARAING